MFFAIIVFLEIFSGLAFIRTKINKEIASSGGNTRTDRMIEVFLATTGALLCISALLVAIGLCVAELSVVGVHGAALVFAVILSLWIGGVPDAHQ